MSDLRTAAQQALEFIRAMNSHGWLLADYESDMERTVAGLEAALAEPVQEPVRRDDGMPTSAEERHLRRLLALRAAMPHTYYDDGEAQGIEHRISIDFMREPVAHIDAKLRALNVARAIAKQEPAFHGFMSADGTRVDLCFTPSSPRSDGTYATAYYTAPPQRKPLSVTDLQDALVYTNLIDRDAIDDPDGYDEGSTLAQIDALHRMLIT